MNSIITSHLKRCVYKGTLFYNACVAAERKVILNGTVHTTVRPFCLIFSGAAALAVT